MASSNERRANLTHNSHLPPLEKVVLAEKQLLTRQNNGGGLGMEKLRQSALWISP